MTGNPVVVLDACVLIPIRLTATLLWLAESKLFQPLWSDAILDEVERNLPKVRVSETAAARRVEAMRVAFGSESLVDGFDGLIGGLKCDPKDRHVLAAAIAGGAEAIVTFNVKDFPEEAIAPYGIQVVGPDEFLLQLLSSRMQSVVGALEHGVGSLRRPSKTINQFLAEVARTVPPFANLAPDAVSDPPESLSPIPALVGDDSVQSSLKALGNLDDLSDPAQVAAAWWIALTEDLDSARRLTYAPQSWQDFLWAIELLKGKSLASKVLHAVDAPDRVAIMRFVPEVANSRVFRSFQTTMTFLTLVKLNNETWCVWGLGPTLCPAQDILGD